MPTLVVPGALLVTVNFHDSGVFKAQTTHGLRMGAAGSLDQALTDAIRTAWKNAFQATGSSGDFMSSSYSAEEMKVLDLRTATGPFFISSINANGAMGTDPLPPQCAVVTKITTALRGRSFRGRVFQPGFAEQVQSNGQVTVAAAAAQQLFWATYETALAGVGAGMSVGVISRKLRQINDATGFSTSTRVYTQRRRSYR